MKTVVFSSFVTGRRQGQINFEAHALNEVTDLDTQDMGTIFKK